jgi:murein DD-endopeptidase MepM/ murein hydrolase activator NlpD
LTAHRARTTLGVALLCALAAISLAAVSLAPAQDLQSRLHQKQARLQDAKHHEGVLSTTISRYTQEIRSLAGQVATLRNREAAVQADLDAAQSELRRDKARLEVLERKLHRSLAVLRQRLVDIYKTDRPDVLSVILASHGFDDMVSRFQYLRKIQEQDTAIAGRVRGLRDETRSTVQRVRALRNQLAAKRDELARTRAALESRQSQLDAARSRKQHALQQVKANEQNLEGDVSDIQAQIQAQIQAAEASQPPQVAGPVQGQYTPGPPSSSGFIWPVNGPVVSPFGPRTINGGYENHPGIDIAVPTGTPIHAAAAGTVALAGPNDGYGNYTCIEHGGGLSTCYAHQETISVSVGQHVTQGQVIGLTDCTGYCFGPHLHFEVRVNGQVVDPMGYLP